jgi:hypothetical protein
MVWSVNVSGLVEQMAAGDSGERQAATRALVAAGAEAVGPLMAALHESPSWYAGGHIEALRHIGDPAFRPLVDALAQGPTPRAHGGGPSPAYPIGIAFTGLRVSDRAMFATVLGHDSANVRSWACAAVAELGADADADAEPYVPRVLALLSDEDPDVRYSACRAVGWRTDESSAHLPALLVLLADPVGFVREEARRAISGIGPRVVPTLREMRRSPGRQRRYALAGLAETVGWDGLDAADQAVVRRLIRIRTPREVPEPFDPTGQWYAIPTSDQAAVLDALDLSDPMPVTMRLGQAAVARAYLQEGTVAYVTPVLDGWTLAFVWNGEFEDGAVALSRRFGTAHAYVEWDDYHGCGYATGWCIAENGAVIRSYAHQDGYSETGAPHPAEEGLVLPHEEIDEADDDVSVCYATDIAGRISVDTSGIGPHTRVEGHPVLALTADGRRDGATPVALPI